MKVLLDYMFRLEGDLATTFCHIISPSNGCSILFVIKLAISYIFLVESSSLSPLSPFSSFPLYPYDN